MPKLQPNTAPLTTDERIDRIAAALKEALPALASEMKSMSDPRRHARMTTLHRAAHDFLMVSTKDQRSSRNRPGRTIPDVLFDSEAIESDDNA